MTILERTQYKLRDAQSYDAVAGDFDDLADRYTQPVAEALARAIRPAERRTVIDMGCGTGIVARAVAAQSPAPKVVGVDLSEGMLATAALRAGAAGLGERLSFVRGDSEALELDSASADGYVSLYAYSHFPNPDRAAAEAFRVLAPGGRIAIAIGSAPPLFSRDGASRAIAMIARRAAVRQDRERSACENLVAHVREHLPTTDEEMIASWSASVRNPIPRLAGILRAAGFTEVATGWTGADFVIPTVEEFWTLETTLSTWSRKFMERASAGECARLKEAYWADARKVLDKGGRLTYRIGAGMVTARRP